MRGRARKVSPSKMSENILRNSCVFSGLHGVVLVESCYAEKVLFTRARRNLYFQKYGKEGCIREEIEGEGGGGWKERGRDRGEF